MTLTAAWGVALAPALAAWARGGLETTLAAAVSTAALAVWLRQSRQGGFDRRASSAAFFLATLTRPEAFVLASIAITMDLAQPGASKSLHDRTRRAVAWWPYFLLLGLLTLGRMIYFGDLLPNTAYAKSGGGLWALQHGTLYVLRFLKQLGPVNLILMATAIFVASRKPRRGVLFVAACCAAHGAVIAWMGGDYQYFGRYMVPLLPALLALAAFGGWKLYDRVRSSQGAWGARLVLLVWAFGVIQLVLPSILEIRDRPWLVTRPWRLVQDQEGPLFRHDFQEMGLTLREINDENDLIAAMAVGALGYYSDRNILDMLGLNDRVIARTPIVEHDRPHWTAGHMKGNAAEVLRRRPDLIVLPMRASERPLAPISEKNISDTPFLRDLVRAREFQEEYDLESHVLPGGRWMNVYRRRSSAEAPVSWSDR